MPVRATILRIEPNDETSRISLVRIDRAANGAGAVCQARR